MSDNQPQHWKEQWEDAAAEERTRLSAAEVEKLLQDVRQGYYGNYYTIWYAIANHATLEQAGWTLYDVLTSNIDYLYRYHAAAGLISLLDKSGVSTDFQPVQLSGNPVFIRDNLPKVRDLLAQKLGEPPDPPPPPRPKK